MPMKAEHGWKMVWIDPAVVKQFVAECNRAGQCAAQESHIQVAAQFGGAPDEQWTLSNHSQARFFMQFAHDSFRWVFITVHPTAGQSPGADRVEDVFNDQQPAGLIEDSAKRANGDPGLMKPPPDYLCQAHCPGGALQQACQAAFTSFAQHRCLLLLVTGMAVAAAATV